MGDSTSMAKGIWKENDNNNNKDPRHDKYKWNILQTQGSTTNLWLH